VQFVLADADQVAGIRQVEATDSGVEKLSHQTEFAAQAAASGGVEILKNREEVKRRLEGRPS
jgi:hypothetical protein